MKRLCATFAVSALVLATSGCSGSDADAGGSPRTAHRTAATTSTGPSAPEVGQNRALARAVVTHVAATMRIPPGAELDESPHHAGRLGHLGCQCGPVDPSLTRTRWWTVPMPYGALVHWYAAHSPARLGSAYFPDGSVSPHGDLFWEMQAASAAYSAPTAVVSYVRSGPGSTALRTDVTLAARDDRTASTLVPPEVTRVDITRTALGGPAHPEYGTVTDPRLLARVTSAFNHLIGAFARARPVACGSPAGDAYVYAVTFHWRGHTLAVDPGAPLCGVGLGLTLDHVHLPQRLQGDRTLDAALEAGL
jgi:hypothetical protein